MPGDGGAGFQAKKNKFFRGRGGGREMAEADGYSG